MSSTTSDASGLLAKFTADNLKLSVKNEPLLIINDSGVKRAILLKSSDGRLQIRNVARELDLLLKERDLDEIVEQLIALVWHYQSEKIKHQIRYALSSDGKSVIIDTQNNNAIRVSADSVEIIPNDSPVKDVYFFSPDAQQKMVLPNLDIEKIGDELKKLNKYVNTSFDILLLLIGYMTYLMGNPKARELPYPILVIQGEKGAGKSFFCNNILRGILDPSSISGLALTKNKEEYFLTINHMFLAVFDNLRSLTKAQSDILCTTATKGSTAKRTLYETTGLTVIDLHSPLVLNGIHDFVQESDLASRCLLVKLDVMKDENRRPEQELKESLARELPDIFGALLLLTSKIIAQLPNVKVTHSARMMDFTKWLAALEKVMNQPEGTLQKRYQNNVKSLMASGTADDSLTIALQKLIKTIKGNEAWKSTPSRLLEKLYELQDKQLLPKGAGALSAKLKGQESSLNANGIFIKFGRDSERYVMVSGNPITV